MKYETNISDKYNAALYIRYTIILSQMIRILLYPEIRSI